MVKIIVVFHEFIADGCQSRFPFLSDDDIEEKESGLADQRLEDVGEDGVFLGRRYDRAVQHCLHLAIALECCFDQGEVLVHFLNLPFLLSEIEESLGVSIG